MGWQSRGGEGPGVRPSSIEAAGKQEQTGVPWAQIPRTSEPTEPVLRAPCSHYRAALGLVGVSRSSAPGAPGSGQLCVLLGQGDR